MEKVAKKEAEDLLKKLGVKPTIKSELVEGGVRLVIDTDENALLIGKHGNTLSSLELILSLIVSKENGDFVRVTIEVGGYKQEREAYLKELAEKLKEEVLSSGGEKTINSLKPWERRFVHMHLADSEVVTESTGEERERVLVIKRK